MGPKKVSGPLIHGFFQGFFKVQILWLKANGIHIRQIVGNHSMTPCRNVQ